MGKNASIILDDDCQRIVSCVERIIIFAYELVWVLRACTSSWKREMCKRQIERNACSANSEWNEAENPPTEPKRETLTDEIHRRRSRKRNLLNWCVYVLTVYNANQKRQNIAATAAAVRTVAIFYLAASCTCTSFSACAITRMCNGAQRWKRCDNHK